MASFQIYQDAEKENHQNVVSNAPAGILQDRKTVGLGLSSKNINPTQVRSNLSVFSVNANGGNGAAILRKSAKANELQIGDSVASNIKGVKVSIAESSAALKTISTTVTTARDVETAAGKGNEENSNILQELEFDRRQHEILVENNSLDDKNAPQIATPMSISEALSPMSVDRSNVAILSSAEKKSQSDILAHQQQSIGLADEGKNVKIIRNDRQRFFEVVEYQDAILEYFRSAEKKHRPKPNYMRRQPDINQSMRTILVDWLVEVSEEYNLDTETLYLAISYIDRFLSHMSVVRSKLQLVGTAAMYIASKYEEIYPPDVNEFVFITDDTYTKAQVLRMEQLILKILAFDLCTPTSYAFINMYAVMSDMTSELKFLTMYICELSLLEADLYLRFTPSMISAAAHALARYILDYEIWSSQLEEITTYNLESLKEVFLNLCKTHKAAATLSQQAIQEKYKSKKYDEVSTLNAVEVTAEQYDDMIKTYNERIATERAGLGIKANTDTVRQMISQNLKAKP